MAGRKSDFTLTKLDDLFSTQEQRDEEKLSKIRDIPLTEIDDFPDHPFKVRDDEDIRRCDTFSCSGNQAQGIFPGQDTWSPCDRVVALGGKAESARKVQLQSRSTAPVYPGFCALQPDRGFRLQGT